MLLMGPTRVHTSLQKPLPLPSLPFASGLNLILLLINQRPIGHVGIQGHVDLEQPFSAMGTLMSQQGKLIWEDKRLKVAQRWGPQAPIRDEEVFRKLISVQPPQLGRVNMRYSELAPYCIERERIQAKCWPSTQGFDHDVYFSSMKFRSHRPACQGIAAGTCLSNCTRRIAMQLCEDDGDAQLR
ncbi:hypothetical protein GH733_009745 [Mirounga leonina]|nr:hypothetical protein GH733_009745 [Mirounga leonina]